MSKDTKLTDKQLADIGAKVYGWDKVFQTYRASAQPTGRVSSGLDYKGEEQFLNTYVEVKDYVYIDRYKAVRFPVKDYDPANNLEQAVGALIVWNAGASRENQLGFHINPSSNIDIEYCKQDGVWRELEIDNNKLNECPRRIMELIAERVKHDDIT